MIVLSLRIIEKLLIIYFTLYFVADILLYLYALYAFGRKYAKRKRKDETDYSGAVVSVIVPSYNEEVSVVQCTRLLLGLDYPAYEVIIVNDGSKDATLELALRNFDFVEDLGARTGLLETSPVKGVYRACGGKLILIDKVNGGKADSVNTGINYSSGQFVCTIDADSILDPNALKQVVRPFLEYPDTIVSGGQLAASNDVILVNNKVVSAKTPRNIWVIWQIIEYIKSFMISRIGLSRFNALLIMSGAFSLYRKQDLLDCGGFLTKLNIHPYIVKTLGKGTQTVCEDMEIVVRLWRYKREHKLKARAVFLPEPVCWTEVPDNGSFLFKQRSRWHQGLGETLKLHRKMILDPAYGITGLIGLPYYFFFELLAPIIKVFSLLFIVAASFYGLIDFRWAMLLLTSVMLTTAIILSSITALIEKWSHKRNDVNRDALRYKSFGDWLWLMGAGIIAEFSYSFFKIFAQIAGLKDFLAGKNNWNKFARKGVQHS